MLKARISVTWLTKTRFSIKSGYQVGYYKNICLSYFTKLTGLNDISIFLLVLVVKEFN